MPTNCHLYQSDRDICHAVQNIHRSWCRDSLGYWSHDNGTVRVSHQGLALHSADVHDSLPVSNWTCLVGTGTQVLNRLVVSIDFMGQQ